MTKHNTGLMSDVLEAILKKHPTKDVFVRQYQLIPERGYLVVFDLGSKLHAGFIRFETKGERILSWSHALG